MSGAPPDNPAKEAVRLRAAPPRVARLSRAMVLTLCTVAAAAGGGALMLALHAPSVRAPEPAPEDPETRPPPAAMADAPKTYGEVPKLGPPLPGDLGRPIVSARDRGVSVPPPAMGPTPPPDPAEAQARQARRQMLDAARTSSLFTGAARTAAPSQASLAQAVAVTPASDAPTAAAEPGEQAAKRAFIERPRATPATSAFRVTPPAGKLLLQAHTVITAALVTAVSSDLPGPVSAQVTRNIYDSLTGRVVLIPQGSKLLGTYDARVTFGQRRVLLAWDRIVFPDGRSLDLDRLVGADAAGRSGLTDGVDAHWGAVGKAALLSSLLGVGVELGSDDDGDIARALRRGVQETVSQTGQQVVRRQLDVQPTLTLRAGLPVTILVTRDVVFDAAP
ncbi:TrbI/VirB10 family protein [Caulobacter sp. UNC358MFTsu5.1]|uniref:TrbI/VirB10 family protein n=1 Tax=Caulobacter sp. UNC358MFTsu5.1 TaxID=1449049 RepID=UPI00055802F4|nr:TrbI/VirB10 family protein [Caulobacter sp. UNC358MFTsu5.1]